MGEIISPNDEAIHQQMNQFQHQCDQLMFWINYKVNKKLLIKVLTNSEFHSLIKQLI